MSDQYVGEIRIVGFNYAPVGWALCDGSLLPISAYQALFAVIGNSFGGDGISNFAVPNLQGRAPMHFSVEIPRGANGGEEVHTLVSPELAEHTHPAMGTSTAAAVESPVNSVWAVTPTMAYSTNATDLEPLDAAAVSTAGGGQPHENRPPYLVLNFIIAFDGIYPTQG